MLSCFPACHLPVCSGAWGYSSQELGVVFPFELHEVALSPFLQCAWVPLSGSATIWPVSRSFRFCFVCKPAEGVLCPVMQVISEDVKQYWP